MIRRIALSLSIVFAAPNFSFADEDFADKNFADKGFGIIGGSITYGESVFSTKSSHSIRSNTQPILFRPERLY